MSKKIFLKSTIALSLFLGNCASTYAGQNYGELEGLYAPKKGWAESHEIYPGADTQEQLGKFKLVLKRQGWSLLSDEDKERVRNRLVIRGVLHGVVESLQTPPFVEHQFSNNDRNGAMFTSNDNVTVTGFTPCSAEAGILNIIQTLNFQSGTGEYQSLQAGGSITMSGTVDLCTLQNDFDIIENQGGLCFGSVSCN